MLFAVLFVVNLTQPYSLQYDQFDGIRTLNLPWGETVTRGDGHKALGPTSLSQDFCAIRIRALRHWAVSTFATAGAPTCGCWLAVGSSCSAGAKVFL